MRQILHGAEAVAPPVAPEAARGGSPALVQAVAPLGSTLVADTPGAVYRRALEEARRQGEGDGASIKQRLQIIENQIEEQEEL